MVILIIATVIGLGTLLHPRNQHKLALLRQLTVSKSLRHAYSSLICNCNIFVLKIAKAATTFAYQVSEIAWNCNRDRGRSQFTTHATANLEPI